MRHGIRDRVSVIDGSVIDAPAYVASKRTGNVVGDRNR
jgi:hypothetical protein